jgi:hypothetical protein
MADIDRNRRVDWSTDERFWRDNYASRPYTDESRGFDFYRPGYQYGYESADRIGRRPWVEAEPDLQRGWERFEGRGQSTWEEIKDTVKDAWDRVTGHDESNPRR